MCLNVLPLCLYMDHVCGLASTEIKMVLDSLVVNHNVGVGNRIQVFWK